MLHNSSRGFVFGITSITACRSTMNFPVLVLSHACVKPRKLKCLPACLDHWRSLRSDGKPSEPISCVFSACMTRLELCGIALAGLTGTAFWRPIRCWKPTTKSSAITHDDHIAGRYSSFSIDRFRGQTHSAEYAWQGAGETIPPAVTLHSFDPRGYFLPSRRCSAISGCGRTTQLSAIRVFEELTQPLMT